MARGFVDSLFFWLSIVLISLRYASAQQFFPPRCASVCTRPSDFVGQNPIIPPSSDPRVAQWSSVALDQIKTNLPRLSPPGVARILAIFGTCMYEATSLFDPGLTPFAATDVPKIGARTPQNVLDAIDGAGFAALESILSGLPSVGKVRQVMQRRQQFPGSGDGFQGVVDSVGTGIPFQNVFGSLNSVGDAVSTAAGQAGRLACQRVIARFTADGYNGRGDKLPGGGNAFGYAGVNIPQTRAGLTACANEMRDLNRWQAICTPRQTSTRVNVGTTDCRVQQWLDPAAGIKTTFALPSGGVTDGASLLSAVKTAHPEVAGAPPQLGVGTAYRDQMMEIIRGSASLDDPQKLIAEFWADGPDFTAPAGHWFKIALDAATSNNLDNFRMAQLLMLVGMAGNDAGVAAWRVKRTFDYIRPLQMVQCGFPGEPNRQMLSWKGPYLGVGLVDISRWQPYQLDTFKTPAFAAYVSGHSSFSFAAAEALRLFFGSDNYRGPRCTSFRTGQSLFEKRIGPGQPGFIPGVTNVPNTGSNSIGFSPRSDVTLCWGTFTEAALQASESRIYGGIHIRADLTDGNALGIEIGRASFVRAMSLFGRPTSVRSVF